MPTTFTSAQGRVITNRTYDVRVLRDVNSSKDKPVPAFWLVSVNPTTGWFQFVARFVTAESAEAAMRALNYLDDMVAVNTPLENLAYEASVRVSNLLNATAASVAEAEALVAEYRSVHEFDNSRPVSPTHEGMYL